MKSVVKKSKKKLLAQVVNSKTGEVIGEKIIEQDDSPPTYKEVLAGGPYVKRHKIQEELMRKFVHVRFKYLEEGDGE
jgi:hypothetical protein